MKKTIKAWAVIWTNKGAKEYGVSQKDRIVSVEPREDIVVLFRENKKHYFAESVALFSKQEEATAFWKGNADWIVVPVVVSFSIKG
jgi:hypothetical protein